MTELDDFDLDQPLHPVDPPKRKRGRPKGSRTLAKEARKAIADEAELAEQERREKGEGDDAERVKAYGNVEEFLKPLTAAQLGQIFGKDRKTVQQRLRGCPAVAKTTRDTFVYDIRQAAAYLVEPKVDVEAWIKKMRPNDLPPYLQDAYWSALEKRQKVEMRAGDLWLTDQVIEVYGELAKRIKATVNLWTDQLENRQKLTPEQRQFFTAQCDGLLSMVFDAFTGLQEERTTGNLQARYREESAAQGKGDDNA